MIASILLTGVVLGAYTPATPAIVTYAQEHNVPACAHEDSVGPCYWDATTRGNGKGRSFIVTDDNEIFFDYTE